MEGQRKKEKSYEIDMCNGPLLSKIIVFAVPLMLSGVLQLLFNAADLVVVGRFTGEEALAAVGSTGSLINLLVNVFIGLSVAANVLVAQYYGAKRWDDLEETVHTSMTVAAIGGVFLSILGFFVASPLLTMMGTPSEVLPLSVLYMKIYFLGMPAMGVYNFGSAILRAVGDTKRPLYFLFVSGVVNVLLNLYFVLSLNMGVAGVATATAASQVVAAVLVVRCLIQTEAPYRIRLQSLRINKNKMFAILRIGLPAGMQGTVFSISNVLIQSSVNSFGAIAMAGNTSASNIEGFVYTCMNALYQTALSFTSQNYGAKKYGRMTKILIYCEVVCGGVGFALGNLALLFGNELLGIYSSEPDVIMYGMKRLGIIGMTYGLCGMMDTMVGGLRGMGYSVLPMVVSLTGACAFRIIWIFTVFAAHRTLETLYWSYPASWAITLAVHLLCYLVIRYRMAKRLARAE